MATAGPKLSDGLKAAVNVADGGPKWLVHHIDAYLGAATDGDRRDPGWFHPSSLHHPCDAYLAFEFLGVRKRAGNVPARTRRIFDNGHGRDRDWKRYLEGAGLSVAAKRPRELCTCGIIWANTREELAELEAAAGMDYPIAGSDGKVAPGIPDIRLWDGRHICIPSLRIRGDFDDLIQNPHEDEPVIHEFKTKNLALWKKLVAPDPDHVIQTQPYMVGTGAKRAIINYECKDDQDLKVFEVPFDIDLWATITGRITRILERLANDIDPDRTPVPYDDKCAFYPPCSNPDTRFVTLVDEYQREMKLV